MKLIAAAITAALTLPYAQAQTNCRGTALTGMVHDSTLALIPGATIMLDGGQLETSGSDGHFRFACVPSGSHHLSTTAPGFAKQNLSVTTPRTASLDFVLKPEEIATQVDVSADDTTATSATTSGPTQTLSGNRLQSLADDPDD